MVPRGIIFLLVEGEVPKTRKTTTMTTTCLWCDSTDHTGYTESPCPVRAAQIAKSKARPTQTAVEFWSEMKGYPVLARCHRDPVMTQDVRAWLTADRNA